MRRNGYTKRRPYKIVPHTGRRNTKLRTQTAKAVHCIELNREQFQGMLRSSSQARCINETPIANSRIDGFRNHAGQPVGYKATLYFTSNELRLLVAYLAWVRFVTEEPDYAQGKIEEIIKCLGSRQVRSIIGKIGRMETERQNKENEGTATTGAFSPGLFTDGYFETVINE